MKNPFGYKDLGEGRGIVTVYSYYTSQKEKGPLEPVTALDKAKRRAEILNTSWNMKRANREN